MESDITVLRGLSKRIDALQAFDVDYVSQLESISQTLIYQIKDEKNITLLDIIAKDVHKLLVLMAKEENKSIIGTRTTLVQILMHCLEKLRALSESVNSLVLFQQIKNCSEKNLKVKSLLLKELFALLVSFGCSDVSVATADEALSCLNHILAGVSRSERLALSERCKSQLQDLVKFLVKCGDYSLQETIMETFTRMTPQTSRESGCRSWFNNFPSDAQQAFIDFGQIVFQVELRPFLNVVNSMWKTGVHTLTCDKLMIGKHQLHNPESEYLPNLYVDFSKVSQSINFFGVQNEGTLEDSNPLVFVKILKHQIKSSFLMAKEKPSYQLTLVLEKPLDNLSNTKYRSETCIIMNVNTDNIDILKNVIGVKLETDLSKHSSQMMDNEQDSIESNDGKKLDKSIRQEPGFYMFKYPDDNIDAEMDMTEPENASSDEETNAKTDGRVATPMNFAPVRVDRSPGKSTYADYLTVVDSDEDIKEQELKGRKATPAAKKNVMPSKATPAEVVVKRKGTPAPLAGGKLLSRNLTPGVVQSAKEVKLQAENPAPVSHLKRSYTPPLPTPGVEMSEEEVSDNSEDSKLAKINKSKNWIATPLLKGKPKRQRTQAAKTKDLKMDYEQRQGKLQGKSGKAITKKSTKEVDENFEPPAKQPRRQQKKVSPPIQPRAQRPRRCAQVSKPKMEREPSVSVRKIQPRKSGIETSPEAAGEESENEFDVRSTSVKKRRMSSKKEDNETQLTMATDEVFKTKPANGKQKKLLPHDDFVNNYNSKQQHITYKGQKEAAAYKKTSDSSKDSTFDHLLQSIPRQVAVKKRSSPRQLPKKNYEEPMLFDELDDDFEPHDSSRLSKHSRVSKPQNKPQMGRKLNLKLEKSVPAKKVAQKRAPMKNEPDKKPVKQLQKTSAEPKRSETKNQEDLIEDYFDEDNMEVASTKNCSTRSVTSELFRRCSVDDEFDNLKEEFLKGNKFERSKPEPTSRQHLNVERVKKLLDHESSASSDNEVCEIIEVKEAPEKIVPNSDSPPYYFEDLFRNSGDEESDEAAEPSPPPKEKMQPKKQEKLKAIAQLKKERAQEESKAKLKLKAQQDEIKAKQVLKAQQEAKANLKRAQEKEAEAKKLFIKAQEEKAKAKELARARQEKEKAEKLARVAEEKEKAKKLARIEEEKAKKLARIEEEKEKAKKLARIEEEKAKKLARVQQEKERAKLLQAAQQQAKAKLARDKELKLKLRTMPENKGRAPITEKTDVVRKKNDKHKVDYSSEEETERNVGYKKKSRQSLNKLLAICKKPPIVESVCYESDESTSSTDSKSEAAEYEALVKKNEQEKTKKPPVKMPDKKRAWKKKPKRVTSEEESDEEVEEEVPKPRKKDVMIAANKSVSKPQNASKSNAAVPKMSHNAKLLMRLKELHKIFKHREIKAKNDQRLEVAMEMKEELIQAMKKEKKDHGVLNMHLKMTKEIVNVLRKNFNLTGLNKDNTGNLTELVEKLSVITESYFDHEELEALAKQVLFERQKAFFKEVHSSVSSVLAMFRLV